MCESRWVIFLVCYEVIVLMFSTFHIIFEKEYDSFYFSKTQRPKSFNFFGAWINYIDVGPTFQILTLLLACSSQVCLKELSKVKNSIQDERRLGVSHSQ